MPKITTPTITPHLWFEKDVVEAVNFYISIFPESKINNIDTFHNTGPNSDMTLNVVSFYLSNQNFMAIDGGPLFKFNEAVSFLIDCDGQDEVDYYWGKLTSASGQESQCGWLKDKFGLSWQVVPKQLNEALANPDKSKAKKAMEKMLEMKKIIIKDLE